MKRSVLIVVSGDPRRSARPAEAVRIAAGLSSNGRLNVTLCLRGDAVLALGADTEDFMDGDHFTRYLPVMAETGRIVFVQSDSTKVFTGEPTVVPVHRIADLELEKLIAGSDRVLRF